MIELGSLVRSQNNDLGIGKVIELSETDAMIEYFCSVGQRIHKTLPLASLSPVRLPYQTRCYLQSAHQNTWLVGRIAAGEESKQKYKINLPDSQTALATEQDIYVRCHLPIADPMEILAMKGQETPYFHDRRLAFVRSLTQQRAASLGMTGLISANIELYPHQVEVVRRVLADPIQRYLLADERGLGKTIEAGVLLRQYLLDEPQGRSVILVPQFLRDAWLQELETKFYLSDFPNRVQVLAFEEADRVSFNGNLGCLIIDEAHQIATLATATADQQKRFQIYKRLAQKCDRLFLLSAIPVFQNEPIFLALLHLLDPTTYPLEGLDQFQAKVQNRQQIGQALFALPTDPENALNQLQQQFPEDETLQNLGQDLQTHHSDPELSEEIRRKLHTHLCDTYRLDRRILRNRRDSVAGFASDRQFNPRVEYDLDERSFDLHDLLEQWRTLAPKEDAYRLIFRILFLTSGTWLGLLEEVLQARLSGLPSSSLNKEFGTENIRVLTKAPKFPQEAEILQGLLRLIQQPSEDGDRLELLKAVLLYQLSERFKLQSYRSNLPKLLDQIQWRVRRPLPDETFPKIVIFTSFRQSCNQLLQYLGETFEPSAVVGYQVGQNRAEQEKALTQFKNNPNCFMLVCEADSEAERNLQFVDWMIDFDLPESPNIWEKRLGKVNRFGSSTLQLTIFAGTDLEDGFQSAWYELCKEGFGIFQQSLANLELYIEQKIPQLEAILFESGAQGILDSIADLKSEIAEAQVKSNEQAILDEIDIRDSDASEYFQALATNEAAHAEIKRSTEGWICQALQFQQMSSPNLSGVRRYRPTTRTLVPVNDLETRFAAYREEYGTYERKIANQHPAVNLYRSGEGFVEALTAYLHWDDRGQAFAMWRWDEDWTEETDWFGFRFNYAIEANLEAIQNILTEARLGDREFQALKRRADALFPPIIETVFFDARPESQGIVEEEALLEILKRSYKGKNSNQSRDYNLAKNRLPLLDTMVEASQWQDFCRQARQTSEELLRDRPAFLELCDHYHQIAHQKLNTRLNQLRLRLNQRSEPVLKQELILETDFSQALLQGIQHPQIQLDSVGFMVVSQRPPSQTDDEGSED